MPMTPPAASPMCGTDATAQSHAGPDRGRMAEEIVRRVAELEPELSDQWRRTAPINHFVVDDVLPPEWTTAIRAAFPQGQSMRLRRSLRELKYVAAQMNRYHPLLEEAIYAFQMPEVVAAIERVTGLAALEPDDLLYAGGISLMARGHFLNPHIDNSHDKFRERYRILNLLYYVSPDWTEDHGGNLELWPKGVRGKPLTVVSRFNRLVVMLTHRDSWHSVSRNTADADRCCVSNYYFSSIPIGGAHYYHVTEFRGRPGQPARDLFLKADNGLRTLIRTRFPRAFKSWQFYDTKAGKKRNGTPS